MGLTFSHLTLQNHEIRVGDETLAALNGVDVSSLDAASFVMV